ncbi:MAG: ATP-dependent RecD-like DNA helicase [Bradymonadales bacterium]|nr:ATP-dependent RecD-like DNA helicase [Bradymonadales bacterium]
MNDDLFPHSRSTLVGALESLTFENQRGDFAVANVRTATGRVKVVGNLRGAVPGERLQVKGKWENNRQFGRQFVASDVVVLPPTTRAGVVRYLSSGLIDGIGKVLAQRLVDAFGDKTLDLIESEPQRLLEVAGIGVVRQRQILQAWEKQRAIRRIMVFLAEHRVSTTFAFRILQVYGDQALQVVQQEPYRLAQDIFGIGFLSADRIARSLGIGADDAGRVAAGLSWVLEEATGEGHTYLPRPLLVEKASQLLEVDTACIETVLETTVAQGSLIEERSSPPRPAAIYTAASHSAEVELAERIYRLMTLSTSPMRRQDLLDRAAAVQSRLAIRLEEKQQSALVTLAGQPLGILTGGPGTGKTTLIHIFCEAVTAGGGTVLLAAPTGRAARRLSESAGRPAETLHRLLRFNFAERRFEKNEKDPLKGDLIIVDEASMLDQYLARSLLRAVPPYGSLLLVGDADQLPSVGPGNVLADLLSVPPVVCARLTEVFRQEGDSDIIRNAHRIRQGLPPQKHSRHRPDESDFFHIAAESPAAAKQRLLRLVCERIPAAFQLDPIEGVQVLSPMHRGECGIDSLNSALQQLVNPDGEPVRLGEREFRVGDKIIQLRNDYQREVFNGQIGRLVAVDPETGDLTVQFEGRDLTYERANLSDLALAYCISIHKSQGSEYPAVVVPITNQHYVLLQRNLLYTAVTRARQLVCLVGERKALLRAIRNDAPLQRHTGLARRLVDRIAAGRPR